MGANRPSPGLLFGISKLRESVDFRPYTPTNDAPAWMRRLAFVAAKDLGSLAVLGPSGIKIDRGSGHRDRFYPDPAVLYLSALSNALRCSGKRVAIGVPPSGRHLPLVLAATAVLANTLEKSKGALRNGSVLVISRDLDIRSRYCDIFVDTELLDDVHPGSRMRPNGERVLLRPRRDESSNHDGGVCFFLPERVLPESIQFSPALVVLDLRYAKWTTRAEVLAPWTAKVGKLCGVVAMYTIGDQDSLSSLISAGFTDLPLDHSAIATCCEQVLRSSPASSEAIEAALTDSVAYLDRRHTITEINDCAALEHLFEQSGDLLYRQQQFDTPEFRRAKWILSALMQLPVPLTWYEMTAQSLGRSSLKRLIELLVSHSSSEKHSGPILQSIRMSLQQIYLALSQANPRATALASVLQKTASVANGKILTLVRDRISEAALESWLTMEAFPGSDWLDHLEIRNCAEFSVTSGREYELTILNGALPRRYRWIAGAGLGRRVLVITYPHESAVVEGQILSFYDESKLRAKHQARTSASALLVPDWNGSSDSGSDTKVARLNLVRPPRRQTSAIGETNEAPIKSGGLAGLAAALEASRRSAEAAVSRTQIWDADSGEDSSDPSEFDADADETVIAIVVNVESRLHGHGRILLRAGSLHEIIRPSAGEDILRVAPEKLRVGDVLLLMEDSSSRESLFDQLVKLAEGQPEMDYLQAFRSTWRSAIQKLRAKFLIPNGVNYSVAYQALKSAGAPVETEQAVRLWLQDQVIGPDAIESIQAVGEVSGVSALSRQARQFDKAFRKIRGIHQGIGRRLSATVRQSFAHLHFGHTTTTREKLEDRLGLPLEELLESVDLARVISIGGSKAASSRSIGLFRASS